MRVARSAGRNVASRTTSIIPNGAAGKRQRVRDANAEQHRLQQARQGERSAQAEHNSDGRQRRALPDHHAHHVRLRRPQRHAHADFMRALRHRVGDQPVDSDRRQQQRDSREQRQQHGVEARLRDGQRQRLLHGADLRQGHARVDGLNVPAKRRRQASGVARRAHCQEHPRTVRLGERHVVGRVRVDCQPQVFHIADYADDLHPLVAEAPARSA